MSLLSFKSINFFKKIFYIEHSICCFLIKNNFVLVGSYDNTYECVFEKVYFSECIFENLTDNVLDTGEQNTGGASHTSTRYSVYLSKHVHGGFIQIILEWQSASQQ